MMDDVIRLYQHGRFSNIPAPEWFERAVDLSSRENVGWHRAVTRAIGAPHQGLTIEATAPIGLDIGFWHSLQYGVYVEIDSGLDMIEQVLVRDTAEWLPFMSAHLTPLLAAVSQAETAFQLKRVGNALISFSRHQCGAHIDPCSGRSRTEGERDENRSANLLGGGPEMTGLTGMRFAPLGYNGQRRSPEEVSRNAMTCAFRFAVSLTGGVFRGYHDAKFFSVTEGLLDAHRQAGTGADRHRHL